MSRADSIRRFIEDLKDLPTLPPVAMRLLDMAADDDVGLRDIGKVIDLPP